MFTDDITNLWNELLQEWNGLCDFDPSTFSGEQYSESANIILPEHIITQDTTTLSFTWTVVIAYLNYIHLLKSDLEAERARLTAWIRAMICKKFNVAVPRDAIMPNTTYSEIRLISETEMAEEYGLIGILDDDDNLYAITSDFALNVDDDEGILTNRFHNILRFVKSNLMSQAKWASLYLPIIGLLSFGKTGHHYSNDEIGREFWKRQFTSLQNEMWIGGLNRFDIIYNAIHWMGPSTLLSFYHEFADKIDRGLSIKMRFVPAGSALICSSHAIMLALDATPLYRPFIETYGSEIAILKDMAERIKDDPTSYHVRSDLFGRTSQLESEDFIEAYDIAISLSPLVQGFIDSTHDDSPLKQIKAVKKHANANYSMYLVYSNLFSHSSREVSRMIRNDGLQETIRFLTSKEDVTAS